MKSQLNWEFQRKIDGRPLGTQVTKLLGVLRIIPGRRTGPLIIQKKKLEYAGIEPRHVKQGLDTNVTSRPRNAPTY